MVRCIIRSKFVGVRVLLLETLNTLQTIVIIIIIIIILVITVMQRIYNYISETNHVCRVHGIAAVLYLQFVLHVMLFHPWNMFCTLTLALPAVCVRANGCFLRFLNFVLAWYVAQVLSEWFRNGSSRHYY